MNVSATYNFDHHSPVREAGLIGNHGTRATKVARKPLSSTSTTPNGSRTPPIVRSSPLISTFIVTPHLLATIAESTCSYPGTRQTPPRPSRHIDQ